MTRNGTLFSYPMSAGSTGGCDELAGEDSERVNG